MDNIKDTYIQIIDRIELQDPLVAEFKRFVQSYTGGNETDFHLLVMALIQFLRDYKILRIKAEGYDKIAKTKEDYQKVFESLKHEYQMAIKMPPQALEPASSKGGPPISQAELDELGPAAPEEDHPQA